MARAPRPAAPALLPALVLLTQHRRSNRHCATRGTASWKHQSGAACSTGAAANCSKQASRGVSTRQAWGLAPRREPRPGTRVVRCRLAPPRRATRRTHGSTAQRNFRLAFCPREASLIDVRARSRRPLPRSSASTAEVSNSPSPPAPPPRPAPPRAVTEIRGHPRRGGALGETPPRQFHPSLDGSTAQRQKPLSARSRISASGHARRSTAQPLNGIRHHPH